MIRHISSKFLCFALGFNLLASLPGLHAAAPDLDAKKGETDLAASGVDTNNFHLAPGPEDGTVAYVAAQLLQQLHFSHRRFDEKISSQFFDFYLESLDPRHMHFLQSDLDQFECYRTNLNNLTLTRDRVANTAPAFEIYCRFVDRLKERTAYAERVLQTEKFTFDSDERIAVARKDMPYPKNMDEAKDMWRQWLRYEYLQEKLGLESADKKTASPKGAEGKTIAQQIVDTLSHRYRRNLRVFTDWNHEDVLGVYLTALAHVYDPHSDYFNKEQMDQFSISMNLTLFGIGAQLRSEDGNCRIQSLVSGGPALKSQKIKEGDYIIAVAQGDQPPVDVVDMNLVKLVQLIRGPKGSEVRLTIVPSLGSSARKVVSLIRDKIPLEDSAAKGRIIDLPNGAASPVRLGVIDLLSFYAPISEEKPGQAGSDASAYGQYTSVDVAKLLAKFKEQKVRGVILDLRRNGGGSLEEAIKLTGLFIKEGPVVQAQGFDGSRQIYSDTDSSVAYDGPVIVLTSRLSASASEIVAGALQDYGRALIVGDISTHGKGTVQHLDPLIRYLRQPDSDTNDPGALKVTIRKFYRASGASTQLKGVLPDIVLPSVLNYLKDIGESSLENPLPWDTISSAKYEKLDLVQPYLPELLKRSTQRVATNQDFAYVREDIDYYRKIEADKTVSLNEKQRLKQKREDEERAKKRDKERLARHEREEKIYEISLKQASLPGLPPPLQITNSVAMKADSAAPTNVVLPGAADIADDADGPKPPPVDPDMEEAERIMVDYLSILPKSSALLATH